MNHINTEALGSTDTDQAVLGGDHIVDPQDMAAFMAATADKFRRWQQRTVTDAIEIGSDLIKVKEALDHGGFGDWLDKQFGERRTAQRLMQVAAKFATKNDTVSHLTLSTVYLLASPSTPEPITNKVLAKIESGEEIDEQTLKWDIGRAKDVAREKKKRSLAAKRAHEQRKTGTKPNKALEEWNRRQAERDEAERKVVDFLVRKLACEDLRELAGYLEKSYWNDLGKCLLKEAAS
jgi:hypothetical protein